MDMRVHIGITLMDAGLRSNVADTNPWTMLDDYKGYRNDTAKFRRKKEIIIAIHTIYFKSNVIKKYHKEQIRRRKSYRDVYLRINLESSKTKPYTVEWQLGMAYCVVPPTATLRVRHVVVASRTNSFFFPFSISENGNNSSQGTIGFGACKSETTNGSQHNR